MWEKLKINVNQAFFSLEDKWFVGFLKKYLPCEIFVWNENNYVIQITINNDRWAFWRIDHDIVRSKTIEGLNYLGGHNYLDRLNNRLNFDRSVRLCNVNRKPRSKDVKRERKERKKNSNDKRVKKGPTMSRSNCTSLFHRTLHIKIVAKYFMDVC